MKPKLERLKRILSFWLWKTENPTDISDYPYSDEETLAEKRP